MRKRINSQQKYDYAGLPTLAIDVRKQNYPQIQSFRQYCPPPQLQPQSLDRSKQSSISKDLQAPRVREFPNPLMKELRRLILNQIDSGDRLYHYLSSSTHKNLLSLYEQDRKKLIEYLNTLIIREMNIDSIRIGLDKKIFAKDQDSKIPLDNSIDHLKKQNESKETIRRRSRSEKREKSVYNNEIDQMKKRLIKLEKGCKNCPFHQKKTQKPQIPKPKQSKHKEGKSELSLDTIKKQLQKALSQNQCKEEFVLIDRCEIQMIIQRLSDVMTDHDSKVSKITKEIQKERKIKQKLKTEIQQLKQNPETASPLSKGLRSSRIQFNTEDQYNEMKNKVNRLYDELGQLVTEVENKDEIIEYLKIENQNLRNDLVELQDINRMIKAQQRTLTEYVESVEQKARYLQDECVNKETQMIQVRVEMEYKQREIMKLTIQCQTALARLQDKESTQVDKATELGDQITKLNQEKQLINVQKEILQNSMNEKDQLIKQLRKQIEELDLSIETVKRDESILKINHENLKNYLISVKDENIRLHSAICMQQKLMSHIEFGDERNSDEHQRNFSNEVNQSRTRNKEPFEEPAGMDKHIEHRLKTLSETGEEVDLIYQFKKQYPESEVEVNQYMLKSQHKKQAPSNLENDFISDEDVRVSNLNQSSDKIVERSEVPKEEIHVRVIKEAHSEDEKESIERASNKNRFENYENQFNRMLQVEETPKDQEVLRLSSSKDLPHVVLSDTIDKAAQGKGQIAVKGCEDSNIIQPDEIDCQVGGQTLNPSSNGTINRINRNIFIKWGSKDPMTPTPRSQRTQSCNTLK